MTYHAVLFDTGGTLFRVVASRPSRVSHVLRSAGLPADSERIAAAVAIADDASGWPDRVPRGTRAEEDLLWQGYCDRVFDLVDVAPDVELRGMLAAQCRWLNWIELFDDTLPALRRLHRSVQLTVLSNNVPSLEEALQRLGIAAYFDDVVISVAVGLSKPDPAVFSLALDRLEATARDALFVDDLADNVDAARRLGLGAILIDRAAQSQHPLALRSLHEVADRALGVCR